MEQLSSEAIRRLVQRTRAAEARTASVRTSWPQAGPHPGLWSRGARVEVPPPGSPVAAPSAPGAAGLEAGIEETGIERRLVRRAEAVWNSLRAGKSLPPASAAAALLRAPFASYALLLSHPAKAGAGARGALEVGFIGEALQGFAGVVAGGADGGTATILADPAATAPLRARLAALGARAIATAAPVHFDSDDDAVAAGRPQLLMRAVALPLAPGAGSSGRAVVVTSWRTLLSSEETAALHRELAAAIDWMQLQRGQG